MNSEQYPRVTKGLLPNLGFGVGLRPPHYSHVLENRPDIDWFEALSENYIGIAGTHGGPPLEILLKIREDYPIVLHGVSLSIGSVDPLDMSYLGRLKELYSIVEPSWVSDHMCWTGEGGVNLHDLLPLPFTEETIRHLVSRVQSVQEFLGRRILLENVSSYLTYDESEMPEWEFLSEVAKRSDSGILLDINNIYVSSVNHGFNPLTFLDGIPRDRVGQFHLAGHTNLDGFLIDTHDEPVPEPVWRLYGEALERFGPVSTLLERDDNIPEFDELMAEIDHAKSIQKEWIGVAERIPAPAQARRASTLAALDHHGA